MFNYNIYLFTYVTTCNYYFLDDFTKYRIFSNENINTNKVNIIKGFNKDQLYSLKVQVNKSNSCITLQYRHSL